MVTIYGQPSCQRCKLLVKYATKNNIEHEYIDVSVDVEARNFILSLGHTELPVVVKTDGSNFAGYRPHLLES